MASSWFHPRSACAREARHALILRPVTAALTAADYCGRIGRVVPRPYAVRRFAAGLAGGFRPRTCRGRLSACGRPVLSVRAGYSSRSMPVCVASIIPRPQANVQHARASGTGCPAGHKALTSCSGSRDRCSIIWRATIAMRPAESAIALPFSQCAERRWSAYRCRRTS